MHEKWIQLYQAVAMAVLPLALLLPAPLRLRRPRRRLSRLMEL